MAVMDQDNFSNISWHSEQAAAGPSSSAALPEPPFEEGEGSRQPQPDLDVDIGELDPAGLGAEILECTVSSPIKENDGTKDAFVSYQITTNSTFPSFQKSVTTVRRRFTDFLFLYKALSKDFPACAVPPLPDKQRMEYVRGDRFGPDFTNRRAHSLQRFLARCALHPILRRSPILHVFLESAEWNATMRSRSSRASMGGSDPSAPGGAGGGGSGGVFDNFADTFINAFTKVHKPDKRFIDVREKSDRLDEDLAHVEKVVARVARREADLELDMKDLAEQFQRLVVLEPGVEPTIHAFAAAVEDGASGLRRLREVTDQDYLGSLRDMQAYSQALKGLLKAREQKQLDFEQLTEYLNKSTADRDQLASGSSGSGLAGLAGGAQALIRSKIEDARGVDHEASRRERQRRLQLRIEELTQEVERAKRTSEMFDGEVVKEVVDFERIKRVEMKRQLSGLADAHIEFHDLVAEIWETYIKEMEKDGELAP